MRIACIDIGILLIEFCRYLHVVRDLRTMHHLHIEHDPRLWVSMLGGEAAYAAAVDAALARVKANDNIFLKF
jgi:hypothetical protein